MIPARSSPLITLLTDFGTRDHYVGVMKGVIAGLCRNAQVIDLSHEVEPFQVAQGGYLLSQSWRWFPRGTVNVAVVDPGVGGERRAIAAHAEGRWFVVPDNGLLSLAGLGGKPVVREILNPAWHLDPVSRTFHGRDIFAPAAALLASGIPFEEAGPLLENWVRLAPQASAVLHIDRFGNVVTSLRPAELHSGQFCFRIGSSSVTRFVESYSSAPPGELFLIGGSGGYLEISLREESAAVRIGCHVGDPVTLELSGKN